MGHQSANVCQVDTWKVVEQRNLPSLWLLLGILYPPSCETKVSPLNAERHLTKSYLLSQLTLSELPGV